MVRCGVEVELRVGHGVAAVVIVEHLLEVADAHVVGDDGEVGAAEVLLGELQVAHRGRQSLAGIEAVVDLGALALEADRDVGAARGVCGPDLAGELAAASQVDVHPEERLAGLGEDLGQSRCIGRVRPSDHVGAAGAFHEHDALEDVRVDAGAGHGLVDQRAKRGDPSRGRYRPAGALGEEHVCATGHGARLEVRLA